MIYRQRKRDFIDPWVGRSHVGPAQRGTGAMSMKTKFFVYVDIPQKLSFVR